MSKTYEQIEEDRKHFRDLWHREVAENQKLQAEVVDMKAKFDAAAKRSQYWKDEHLAGNKENQRLRAAIRKARNHQTEMGGSFNDWFHGIQTILGEALKGGE